MDNVTRDYNAYLSSVFPGTQWALERLDEGNVNVTLRATKQSGICPYESLVLKHAFPFVQDVGPEFPFSLDRQTVESIALSSVLNLVKDVWLQSQRPVQAIPFVLPQCLRHDKGCEVNLHLSDKDTETSVLLLEDVGQLVNILDGLKIFASQDAQSPDQRQKQIASLGLSLGYTFASLHSRQLVQSLMAAVPKSQAVMRSSLSRRLTWLATIDPLMDFLAPLHNAEELYRRVVDDFEAMATESQSCFVHGDLHSGSVLLQRADVLDHTADLTLVPVILDWEHAHLDGRGVNGDIAKFLAVFQCELIAAEGTDPALHEILWLFISKFCAAYREEADLRCTMRSDDHCTYLMRSALIVHGREVINYAHDCLGEHNKRDEVVRAGVWYLEMAGASMDEFVSKERVARIRSEDRCLVQSVFNEALETQ